MDFPLSRCQKRKLYSKHSAIYCNENAKNHFKIFRKLRYFLSKSMCKCMSTTLKDTPECSYRLPRAKNKAHEYSRLKTIIFHNKQQLERCDLWNALANLVTKNHNKGQTCWLKLRAGIKTNYFYSDKMEASLSCLAEQQILIALGFLITE